MNAKPPGKPRLNPTLKLVLDLGPLVVFFFVNSRWNIYAGTATFMAAIAVALAVSYALTRHLPIMAIVSGVVVAVFGGLTLALHDETFIKLKPTIIYVTFGSVLVGGLIFRKPLLAMVFDSVFDLDEEGWRKLTLRWALFFFALAIANEIVWRTQSTEFWFGFKGFAIMLTLAFGALQYPLLLRHANKESPQDKTAGS